MNCKAVIFDLDDTLFDREAAQIRVIELFTRRLPHIFQSYNIDNVIEAFKESDRLSVIDFEVGAPPDSLRRTRSQIFLQLLGITEECQDVITEMYVKDYPALNLPITNAVPVVRKIKERLSVAVVSNGLPDVQYKKIKAIGLNDIFSHIVLSEEIGIRKPDPGIFHHAADLLKVEPSECLYVGDSYSYDVIGANAAGMQVCWFKPDSKDTEGTEIQPDFVITDLRELIKILGL